MQVNYQGNRDAKIVLLQIIGEHELPLLEEELSHIKAITQSTDFLFITVQVDSWNDDLSPWVAEPIFGDAAFAGNAEKLLIRIKNEVIGPLLSDNQDIKIFAGGYSLAGLFVLWAAYQTNLFEGIAAVSPSVWFPGFVDFVHNNKILTNRVYLSLGDKEAKTRNQILAQVANDIRDVYRSLEDNRLSCILAWNKGNHFKEPALRMAKGFAWLMNNEKIHS
jgi:predicted alpha/beta superfamily hydrolase